MKTLIATILLSSFSLNSSPPINKIAEYKATSAKEQKVKQIFEEIDKLPFKYKDIIKKSVLLESSYLKSDIALNNNNICGMRQAKQRITTAIGSRSGYAKYKTIHDCLIDRLLFETKFMEDLNREEYLDFLNRVYSSGSGEYTEVLMDIKLDRYENKQ